MADNEYVDDPNISDESHLWRRIPPNPPFLVDDKNQNRKRISSAAFEDHPNGTPMSVAIAQIAEEHGREPKDILKDHDGYGLAGLVVQDVRENNLGVCKKPLPDQPEHGEVFGPKPKSVRRNLALAAFWVIKPVGVD